MLREFRVQSSEFIPSHNSTPATGGARGEFRVPSVGKCSSTLRTGFRSAGRPRARFLTFAYFGLRPIFGVIVITFGSFLHVCITRLRFIRRSLSYASLSFNNGTYAMAATMSALRLRHSSSCALRAPGCSSYLAPPSRVVCLDAGISRGTSLSASAAGSAAHVALRAAPRPLSTGSTLPVACRGRPCC